MSQGPRKDVPRVVIVGGGFGGLNAARKLARAPVRVTLVDRRNHHVFQPLLYQVASAALNPADIAAPIRGVLRQQKNAEVLLADVTAVDLAHKRIILDDGMLDFDYLVIATGATHSYFGHDEWATYAPGLKTLDDAIDIRRRVLIAYEEAEREADSDCRKQWMTFVVVGGGPTGVEMAGSLAEIAHDTLRRDFRHIDPDEARVILVEGEPRVLPAYQEKLSASAKRQLEARITSVADALDAMISDRPYRQKTGLEKASAELRRCAGTQFDPVVVHACLRAIETGKIIPLSHEQIHSALHPFSPTPHSNQPAA